MEETNSEHKPDMEDMEAPETIETNTNEEAAETIGTTQLETVQPVEVATIEESTENQAENAGIESKEFENIDVAKDVNRKEKSTEITIDSKKNEDANNTDDPVATKSSEAKEGTEVSKLAEASEATLESESTQMQSQTDAESTDADATAEAPLDKTATSYAYTKLRKEFGRQCIFSHATFNLCEMYPDENLKKQYCQAKSVQIATQNIPQMAEDEVQTEDANMTHLGLNHYEGGWPNDINILNEHTKSEYCKSNRDTAEYREQLKRLCVKMEHKIAQNNAVNLFEEYFTEEHADIGRSYKPQIESIGFFEYPVRKQRVVASHSAIASITNDKMVVSYTLDSKGQMNIDQNGLSSYVWDLNYTLQPVLELKCTSTLSTAEYNEKDPFVIAAGQTDGIISVFDARIGGHAQLESIHEYSHRERVSALRWTMSKGNIEFCTCANDSYVMWWDVRNLSKPIESFQLEFNSAGCSTLDYTFSMPTRFLVGMSDGQIVNGNKRGKTYAERFTYAVKSFTGPVHAVDRNPFADKYFISIGDQSLRLWSDENRETPVMQTGEYAHDLSCGTWNRNRCSNFFVGHSTGTVDMWDLLYDQYKPIASITMTNSKVEHIRSHPGGKLAISSHANGQVHMMQIPDFLSSHFIIEKAKLIEILDRELSREVLFLTKIREQRMLLAQQKDEPVNEEAVKAAVANAIEKCSNDFESIIEKEKNKGGVQKGQQEYKDKENWWINANLWFENGFFWNSITFSRIQ